MPRHWRHKLALIPFWLLCTIALIVWIWEPPDLKFDRDRSAWSAIAPIAVWVLLALVIIKTLKRRPPESISTVAISAVACMVAMVTWLPSCPDVLRYSRLWQGSLHFYTTSRLPRLSLALLVCSFPLSLVGVVTLAFWLTRLEVLCLTVCSSIAGAAAIGIAFNSGLANSGQGLLFMVAWFAAHALTLIAWATLSRPYVDDWLHKCRGCNYDLRGLETPRCPECGRDISKLQIEYLSIDANELPAAVLAPDKLEGAAPNSAVSEKDQTNT